MIANTNEEIHGHAVLEMMMESGHKYSRESLIETINERFGENARFYICSGGGMTASELVEKLMAKGKFIGEETAFEFNPATKCNH